MVKLLHLYAAMEVKSMSKALIEIPIKQVSQFSLQPLSFENPNFPMKEPNLPGIRCSSSSLLYMEKKNKMLMKVNQRIRTIKVIVLFK